MSIEKARTGKPSLYLKGEGCQEETIQPLKFSQRFGGVSVESMLGKVTGLSQETCMRVVKSTTDSTTLETKKAVSAQTGVGVLHSSVEVPVMEMERRRGSCADAYRTDRESGDGSQELPTPLLPIGDMKIRKLQQTLYRQAKSKPEWKAWSLYGDVCRKDVLETALWQVISNDGSPGVDGLGLEALSKDETYRERWLMELEKDLREKTYKPSPVRRVYILKDNGKKRPLGIPTVRDRVVQTAVVLLLLPIFEADFHENSFAYRPKREAKQAIDAIKKALLSGRREVVDADLSGYFDSIPHAKLMRLVKGRVSDGSVLKLIRGWLRAPIVEENPETGGKRTVINRCGTPQGGVISPLLANLYLDKLDKLVNTGKQCNAVMVRYADDFVVLCRKGQGHEVMKRLKKWLTVRELKLNEEKTRIVDFEKESFDFLGFRLTYRCAKSGKKYPHCEPSPKSINKLYKSIRAETGRDSFWKDPSEVVTRINRRVQGWTNYFHYANSSAVFTKLQWRTRQRLRLWLWKKHDKSKAHYGEAYSNEKLHTVYGLVEFPMHAKW